MFNAIGIKALAVRSAIILGVLASSCTAHALAQPIDSFSDHLLNRAQENGFAVKPLYRFD